MICVINTKARGPGESPGTLFPHPRPCSNTYVKPGRSLGFSLAATGDFGDPACRVQTTKTSMITQPPKHQGFVFFYMICTTPESQCFLYHSCTKHPQGSVRLYRGKRPNSYFHIKLNYFTQNQRGCTSLCKFFILPYKA